MKQNRTQCFQVFESIPNQTIYNKQTGNDWLPFVLHALWDYHLTMNVERISEQRCAGS